MLKNSLEVLLAKQDLKQHQAFILSLSEQLGVSVLESAAALLYHHKIAPTFYANDWQRGKKNNLELALVPSKVKLVRYRLAVGQKHQVLAEEIKNILVDIAGVEKNQIGKLDIRNHYTLVDLPYGMPADIFQLLSETEINNKKLNIKRTKQYGKHNNQ
ncbi:MAG: hypothetical protein HFP77_08035 [Methylococcales symbiont of Iophon sp. n. MRB-2018]|nr:MAG: hypothetical protein HFP77_08035 [Methylococcales symbiont of Iophon sp. n. MRB-2018]KAF3979179.1 MAG: hypothetical protein HFP76_08785 [Methylococcales symbiont of Iophon sp. n. MRB-2018]